MDNDIWTDAQLKLLDEVLTAQEVADGWQRSLGSVVNALLRGKLAARQAGKMRLWLISKSSVIALWGERINNDGSSG